MRSKDIIILRWESDEYDTVIEHTYKVDPDLGLSDIEFDLIEVFIAFVKARGYPDKGVNELFMRD